MPGKAMLCRDALQSCLDGLVTPARLERIASRLSLPPSHSTIRVNTLKISPTEALASLQGTLERTYGGLFEASLDPTIHDMIIIQSRTDTSNVIPSDLPVAVSPDCGKAVMRGANVFVPGIVAMHPAAKRTERVSVYIDLFNNLTKGAKIAECQPADQYLFIGNGTLNFVPRILDRDELFAGEKSVSKGVGIRMSEPLFAHPDFELLSRDLFYPQNLPSIVTAHVLGVKPGMSVADMCASPGGKSAHIGALLANQGKLYCFDKSLKKVQVLQHTLETAGVTCATCLAVDSRSAALDAQVDAVLLDPPCSGFGQRPVLSSEQIDLDSSIYQYQFQFVKNAISILKVGGVLVYSTCTINSEENEAVVSRILSSYDCLRLVPIELPFGEAGLQLPGAPEEVSAFTKRFMPDGPDDSNAFFIAKFEKIAFHL